MNFREIIKENRRKTYIVISLYFLIYLGIGLLLDTVIYNQPYPLLEMFKFFLTFKLIPIATISMFSIAFISVLVAIFFFKRIQLSGEPHTEITQDSKEYRDLYNIVEELCIAAGIRYVPKIYVIHANYLNAFASGWNQDNTIIAITDGLYNRLNRSELSAVIGHELTHILHEDIKLTLIIGVATNIILFVTDFIIYGILSSRKSSESADKAKMILLVLHFILPIITILLQMWLSRSREYMADSGSVQLIRDPVAMQSALAKIFSSNGTRDIQEMNKNQTRKAAYIFEPGDSLFSTHPSIKNRIDKLKGLKNDIRFRK